VRGQQLDQQRRTAGVQIRCPADLAAGCDLHDRGNELEQHGLVVLDPCGQQHRPSLVDHNAMMFSFA
jgi:hypothetical protein